MVKIPESSCVLTTRGYVPAKYLDDKLEAVSYAGKAYKIESINIFDDTCYVCKIKSKKNRIPSYFTANTQVLVNSDFYEIKVIDSGRIDVKFGFPPSTFKVLSFPELISLFISLRRFKDKTIDKVLTREPGFFPQALLQAQLDRRYTKGRFFPGFLGLDIDNRKELFRLLTKDWESTRIHFSRHTEDLLNLLECYSLISDNAFISCLSPTDDLKRLCISVDERNYFNKITYNYLELRNMRFVEIQNRSDTLIVNGYVISC